MYQWRKFEFFEYKYGGKSKIPEEIKGKINRSSGGRGKVAVGCDDGTVSLLDRGLKFNYDFPAHSSSVSPAFKQHNVLVTIGEDEQMSPQISPTCVKVFDLDKTYSESTSKPVPECVQTLRVFTNHFPEAKVTSFLVLEEAPPMLLIAIGLESGSIYCIKGDTARERITRFQLHVNNAPDKSLSAITGLGFRVDGQALQLFAVTSSSVSLFNLNYQPPRKQTLDQIGCHVNGVAMSDRLEAGANNWET